MRYLSCAVAEGVSHFVSVITRVPDIQAHNLEGVCGESASFDLTAADLAGCIQEVVLISLLLH